MASEFEVRVLPRRNNQVMLTVWQHPNGTGPARRRQQPPVQVERLWGLPLQATREEVLSLVQRGGHRLTVLAPKDSSLRLPEEAGVRLSVLVMAVKPLRKLDRINQVVHGIEEMSREEATYWFSKAVGAPSYNGRRRVLKALRILLAAE